MYGLRRIRCDVPEVTVCGRVAPRISGLEWHRRDMLTSADQARSGMIPGTAPAWTLLDLASGFGSAVKRSGFASAERLIRAQGLRLRGAKAGELAEERKRGKKPSETGLTCFSGLRPTVKPSCLRAAAA